MNMNNNQEAQQTKTETTNTGTPLQPTENQKQLKKQEATKKDEKKNKQE